MGKGGKQIALDKNGIFFLSLFLLKLLVMAGKCDGMNDETCRSFCRLVFVCQ